ncbi:hypothetical protein ACFOWX_05145 [Sphingorhabdus arenilitoris]|uniref:Uncharacterized protein n=1 Tax=Sphingorhabdus arenilitoris TaxID=1490041 RepID=A0ABV8REN4_9SPHN
MNLAKSGLFTGAMLMSLGFLSACGAGEDNSQRQPGNAPEASTATTAPPEAGSEIDAAAEEAMKAAETKLDDEAQSAAPAKSATTQ